MAAKKYAAAKASPANAGAATAPVWNAALIVLSIGYALWLLVNRGRLSWPPNELLAGAYTLAGCLALAGPVILLRREAGEGGLGDLVWMTGGLLIWVHDLAAAVRGEFRAISWPTPLGAQALGLTILAVAIASWRLHPTGRNWTWTNVIGWVLGLFWIGMGIVALIPPGSTGLATR